MYIIPKMSHIEGHCEDCKTYGPLIKVEACADDNCCYKMICQKGCVHYCHNGHLNHVYGDDQDRVQCQVCTDEFHIKSLWWGISRAEHFRRYDY